MPLERIQAATGGINSDAAPDYVGVLEAPYLTNLLPGVPGKLRLRGPLELSADLAGAASELFSFWAHDDNVLVTVPGAPAKTYRVVTSTMAATDVTAAIVKKPTSYAHARYGAYVYGMIDDANPVALGRWDGAASAIVLQANAPRQFLDIQVFAQRLFILGGSAPGTVPPVVNSDRVLFWTDPNPSADLSLLASWQDDVSGLVNQLQYDGDDVPMALAGCGRFMAIIGSRSIRLLTGSGSSSFALRKLANVGCGETYGPPAVVEFEDGFYFMSDHGPYFCDGATVTALAESRMGSSWEAAQSSPTSWITAAEFTRGYVAFCASSVSIGGAGMFLFDQTSRAWTQITSNATLSTEPFSVHRSSRYPLIWDGRYLFRAEKITSPVLLRYKTGDISNAAVTTDIPLDWHTRAVRLAAPGNVAVVRRILIDYCLSNSSAVAAVSQLTLRVYDGRDNAITTYVMPAQVDTETRQRAQFAVNAEVDSLTLAFTLANQATAQILKCELYDAWIEFDPAQKRAAV